MDIGKGTIKTQILPWAKCRTAVLLIRFLPFRKLVSRLDWWGTVFANTADPGAFGALNLQSEVCYL